MGQAAQPLVISSTPCEGVKQGESLLPGLIVTSKLVPHDGAAQHLRKWNEKVCLFYCQRFGNSCIWGILRTVMKNAYELKNGFSSLLHQNRLTFGSLFRPLTHTFLEPDTPRHAAAATTTVRVLRQHCDGHSHSPETSLAGGEHASPVSSALLWESHPNCAHSQACHKAGR